MLRQRLATQRLDAAPLSTAAEVVRLLTCVQSQERDHAFFSLGMRTSADTYAAVQAEHDDGEVLRTHILRPTWHFVARNDIRWILAATSARVEAGMLGTHRRVGIADSRLQGRFLDALANLLRDRNHLSRIEIGQALAGRGRLPAAGEPLGHLLMIAEIRGVICSGPMRGVHHSYALMDEAVPLVSALSYEEGVARLTQRFFAGHGPASVKDLCRWASLKVADATAAVEALAGSIASTDVEGARLYFDPAVTARRTRPHTAYLLPAYDEAILTYPQLNFPSLPDHPYAGEADQFWAHVIADGTNVGLWKRKVAGPTVRVEARLAPSLGAEPRARVFEAAQRLARFVGKNLEYVEDEGAPKA